MFLVGLLLAVVAPANAKAPTLDVARSRLHDNYPAHALQAREQGTVAVTLNVEPDGRAKGCAVTQTSGYPDLDQAACDEFTRFARFNPARDDEGHAVEGKFSTKFTFKLPH